MDTLFNKSKIRIGIDTIKIKLDNISIFELNLIDKLVDNLKKALYQNEISIFLKDKNYYVKNTDSNCYLAKIYRTGKYSCTIEIFGMCQTITEFKLTEHHTIILSVIGNLTDIEMTLEKMDVSLDFFYPHDRSFVFDGSRRADFVDIINYQSKFPFVYLNNISMHTIRVPKRQKPIIKFALNHKDIKSTENKKTGDCYYRWVKPTSNYLKWITYGECEKNESTHFEIKINKRKILSKVSNFFDGSEKFSSDYDPETETYIKKGSKKVSNIKYDKSNRDEQKHGCIKDVYDAIVKDMVDTDDEYDDLMNYFRHTRVELRFLKPAVSTRQSSLDLNSELSYGKLLDYIKKEIKKITIFILKPDVSTDDYLDLYKKRLKEVNTTCKLTSDNFGKILEATADEWNDFENKMNFLKAQFIK
jgi:hypothetical protein